MPRLSSPLDAKASVRSPYALDRSQQNSCVGTVCPPAVRKASETPTHALCALMSSRVCPPSFRGSRANPSIHNVIRRPGRNLTGNLVSLRSLSRFWWSQTGSNRRPHACKARALPTELWHLPRSRARLGACPTCSPEGSMVGPGRLELPTSRLSGVCSNHLSYRPLKRHVQATHRIQAQTRDRTTTSTGCGVLRKEKRRRRRLACLYMSMTNQ